MKVITLKYLHLDLWGEAMKIYSRQKKRGYNLTKQQLKKWGLSYDKLIFGKPSYDLFVDDKSLGFKKKLA